MKLFKIIIFFLFASFAIQAQEIKKDTIHMGYVLTDNDTILGDTIQLPEIIIERHKMSEDDKKQFQLLQKRVYITYPYARVAAERLTALNRGMQKFTNNRDKKRYFKIVEDYLSNEFEARLKKLSKKQGQILVKLIDRQTGTSTYDLIKNLKSGWKAFWSNTAASMFDIDLKLKYQPYDVNEDYLIETILVRAFESGRLRNQTPANPVDYDKLADSWAAKTNKAN
jgi:ABC-type transporter MlaC component